MRHLTALGALILAAVLAIALLLKGPADAQALPRGFFGIVPQMAVGKRDMARMHAGGVETIRMPLSWGATQPAPGGDYDWSGYDKTVAIAAEDELEVLPILFSTPSWLAHDERVLPVADARRRRGWAEFVGAAVERYGSRGEFWREHGPTSKRPLPKLPIRAWQIWNEEDFFYFAKPVSPRGYAALLAISNRAGRRAAPRAQLALGGLFGAPPQGPPPAMDAVSFLDRLYGIRGARASFDAVALH